MQSVLDDDAIPRKHASKLTFGSAILIVGMFVVSTFSANWAQARTRNSTALREAAPPAVIGNVWNGTDHQPTAASDPPLETTTEETIDRTLEALDKQLLQFKLPEAPS